MVRHPAGEGRQLLDQLPPWPGSFYLVFDMPRESGHLPQLFALAL